jgi:hypothetical protein
MCAWTPPSPRGFKLPLKISLAGILRRVLWVLISCIAIPGKKKKTDPLSSENSIFQKKKRAPIDKPSLPLVRGLGLPNNQENTASTKEGIFTKPTPAGPGTLGFLKAKYIYRPIRELISKQHDPVQDVYPEWGLASEPTSDPIQKLFKFWH